MSIIFKALSKIWRALAKFNVSKSTVHKDLQDRLIYINKDLYDQVDNILEYHKEIRHIRGGESTRKKYQKMY